MPRTVTVTTTSRLHFGLLSFGGRTKRQFGGAGVMVRPPEICVQVSAARELTVAGSLDSRVHAIVERLSQVQSLDRLPECRVDVLEAPPEHVGLGTGTQLTLAVVAALNAWKGRAPLDAVELASLSGRAGRSAIGTYGFLH